MNNDLMTGISNISLDAGLGYAIGYMAFTANPLLTAGLAATISLIKILTRPIFASVLNETKLFSSRTQTNEPLRNKIILLCGLKLSIDMLLGASLFATVAAGVFAVKLSAVPLISLVGFTLLVERGGQLVKSASSLAAHYACKA